MDTGCVCGHTRAQHLLNLSGKCTALASTSGPGLCHCRSFLEYVERDVVDRVLAAYGKLQ